MRARSFATAATLTLVLAPGVAGAEDGLAGRVTVAFEAGTQSELSGSQMAATQGTLIDKPVSIDSKRYRDIYKPDLRLQGLLGYGLTSHLELVVRGSYYKADGVGVEAGTFDGHPMSVFFDDSSLPRPYKEYGAELGLRYYISPRGRLRSYLGPVVGVRSVSSLLVSFSVPEASTAVLNVPFTEKTTLPVFGLDLGFAFMLTPQLYLGVNTGLRYQPAATQSNALPGLQGIDDVGARWTAPVVATLGVRF